MSSKPEEKVGEDRVGASEDAKNVVEASKKESENGIKASKKEAGDLKKHQSRQATGNEEQNDVDAPREKKEKKPETSKEEVWDSIEISEEEVWENAETFEEEAKDQYLETEQSTRDEPLEGQLADEQLAWTSKDDQTNSGVKQGKIQETVHFEIDEHSIQELDSDIETSERLGGEWNDPVEGKDEPKTQERATKRSIPVNNQKPLDDHEKLQLASEEVYKLARLARIAAQEEEKARKTYRDTKSRSQKATENLEKGERKLTGISKNRKPSAHDKKLQVAKEKVSELFQMARTAVRDEEEALKQYQNAKATNEKAEEALRSAEQKLIGISNNRKNAVSREEEAETTDAKARLSSSKYEYRYDKHGRVVARVRRRQPPRKRLDRHQDMMNGWYERTREMQKVLGDLTALNDDLDDTAYGQSSLYRQSRDDSSSKVHRNADDESHRQQSDYHQDRIDGWYKQTREFQEYLGMATTPNDDIHSTTHRRSPYILKRDGGSAKAPRRGG